MIYTDEVMALEDSVEQLADELLTSSLANDYLEKYQALAASRAAAEKINAFVKAKESFERIERFGTYAPDFTQKRRELRQKKRALDLDDTVAAFRMSETALQELLDNMCVDISNSISDTIKVDAGNPFFEFASRGCGGSCHVDQ
ncbi:YlbF family regulator [Vagococcus acidifermentans]|uniref:Uncharacterized protein n=1 Tax=Vagococcus acidifermentans TaxID=564710 RepID=A0A430B067_9ENTE|nr:YlbF family regulator [Vagococcus acidifermentans]RSU13743.1 hypothetical protein CBF27_02250 [Vagococcus acidifermentans]